MLIVRVAAVVALIATLPAIARAAVLADTGLTATVALTAEEVELDFCENDECPFSYRVYRYTASRFHVAGGTATAISFGDADGETGVNLYRDTSGLLLPTNENRVWSAWYYDNTSSSPLTGPGFDTHLNPMLRRFGGLNLVLAEGDYWLELVTGGPTFGFEPSIFAGTGSGVIGEFLENTLDGVEPFYTYSTGPQVGIRIEGVLAPVPEPASWALLIAGFAAVGTAQRRCRQIAG